MAKKGVREVRRVMTSYGGVQTLTALPSMQCAAKDGGGRRVGCGDAERRDRDAPENAAAQSRHLVRDRRAASEFAKC